MNMEETFGGKLLFIEDGRPKVRNFSSLVIHTCTGDRVEIPHFRGFVEIASGCGSCRSLEVLLPRKDTKRLVQGYLRTQRKVILDRRWVTILVVLGWIIRSVVAAL